MRQPDPDASQPRGQAHRDCSVSQLQMPMGVQLRPRRTPPLLPEGVERAVAHTGPQSLARVSTRHRAHGVGTVDHGPRRPSRPALVPLGPVFHYRGPGFCFGLPLGSQAGFTLTAAVLLGLLAYLCRDDTQKVVSRSAEPPAPRLPCHLPGTPGLAGHRHGGARRRRDRWLGPAHLGASRGDHDGDMEQPAPGGRGGTIPRGRQRDWGRGAGRWWREHRRRSRERTHVGRPRVLRRPRGRQVPGVPGNGATGVVPVGLKHTNTSSVSWTKAGTK